MCCEGRTGSKHFFIFLLKKKNKIKSSLVKELVKQQVLYIMIQSSKGQLERLDWLQPNETEASCDQLLCCSMNDKGNN